MDAAVKTYFAKIGAKGGTATNAKLTPKQLKRKMRRAARARWGNPKMGKPKTAKIRKKAA